MTSQETKHNEAIASEPMSDPVANSDGAKSPSRKRIIASLVVFAIFIGLSILFWLNWDQVKEFITFISDQEAFGEYLRSFGVWGPLVLFLAQTIQVFIAFIPGHVVSISGGYVFGFGWGFIMNLSFTVIASQAAYFLARWAGRPIVYKLVDRETVDYWEAVANKKGTLFFTIAFLLPIFPSDAMNFVGGLSGISPGRFFIASLIGRMPSSIMLSMIGAYGTEFSPLAWGVIITIFLVVLFLGQFGTKWVRRTIDEHTAAEKAELAERIASQADLEEPVIEVEQEAIL